MAAPTPTPDGFDRRPRTGERLTRTIFNVVALGAIAGAPVATVSLWLLLTDPAVAADLADGADAGSALSVARTLFYTLGRALASMLAYL